MHWADRRAKFRAILEGDACVHPGSVYDPVSARIAEEVGFELMMFAGSVGSHAVLGAPDLIVLTLTEFAQQAYRINRAGSLPLLVDADHGYGNALSARRTVEELETAGVAGLTIEDTDLPEPFGAGGKARLISVEEGVGKVKAALAGRQDPALCVCGRTSAPSIAGIDEAVKRAKAYEAAGADAMFFSGVKTMDELDKLAEAIRIPIILGGGGGLGSKEDMAARNVRVCLQGHHPYMASMQATYDTLKALRDGVAPGDLKGVASGDLMKKLLRDADYRQGMKDWLA
jgi:carboxyvinyl-carboxyphosphonate phosphorylmutase